MELKQSVEKSLTDLASLPEEKKKEKNKDIISMINYYDGLTKNIEDRRIRLSEISWQTLTISVTALGLIFAIPLISALKILLLGLFLTFIFEAIAKIIEYQHQSHFRYPFLEYPEYGNKWKWFYYGNKYIPKINDNPLKPKNNIENDLKNFLKGLNLFVENYSSKIPR